MLAPRADPMTDPISPTAPTAADDAGDRRRRLEREREAADQLSRLHGALELQAAVLALLLPAGSQRAVRAWRAETAALPNIAAVRDQVSHLPGTARLPWLEALVSRLRDQPLDARQTLLEATRRVMAARGAVRPIDRLHWLAMRQWLGEGSAAESRAPAEAELSRLPQADVSAIASYSAFLARIVPIDTADAAEPADAAAVPPGIAWYDTVMAPWQPHASVAPCVAPDTDGLVHALQQLQVLPWMQRPVLARGWVSAAQQHSRHGRLGDGAADALRLSCTLLDSPLPPELARHFGAMPTA
jgi:hypothetical protein